METAQMILAKLRRPEPVHKWKEYADEIAEADGYVEPKPQGFTIELCDGSRNITFKGGLTEEHYWYFSPKLAEESDKGLFAKAVLQNQTRCQSSLEWETAWSELCRRYDCHESEDIPKVVEAAGFIRLLDELKQSAQRFRDAHVRPNEPPARSILSQDASGLWHTADYLVCKDKAGRTHNCSPVVAKLIEVLNNALKEGIGEMYLTTLLEEAKRLSSKNLPLVAQIKYMEFNNTRLDRFFFRSGVWKTLVTSGKKKGCYRLDL